MPHVTRTLKSACLILIAAASTMAADTPPHALKDGQKTVLEEDVLGEAKPVDEEIIVEANPYLKSMNGKVREAFAAFMNGDYGTSASAFGAMATRVDQEAVIADLNLFLMCSPRQAARCPSPLSQARYDRAPALHAVLSYMEGVSLARLGKFDASREALKHTLKIDKSYTDARIDYAMVSILAGDTESAEVHLKTLKRHLRRCTRDCEQFTARVAKLEGLYSAAQEAQTP